MKQKLFIYLELGLVITFALVALGITITAPVQAYKEYKNSNLQYAKVVEIDDIKEQFGTSWALPNVKTISMYAFGLPVMISIYNDVKRYKTQSFGSIFVNAVLLISVFCFLYYSIDIGLKVFDFFI